MKRFVMTLALACALSVSALAGEIPMSGVASPQPGDIPTSGFASPSPGEISSGDFAQQTMGDEVIVNVLGILCGLVI